MPPVASAEHGGRLHWKGRAHRGGGNMRLALPSLKGGVGKTTTAVNLAAAFARSGLSALLIDLDPQASATFSLGVGREQAEVSTAEVVEGAAEAAEAVQE